LKIPKGQPEAENRKRAMTKSQTHNTTQKTDGQTTRISTKTGVNSDARLCNF